MTMLGRHLLQTGQLRDGIDLDEVRDVLWNYLAIDTYERLVLIQGWPLERYSQWLTRAYRRSLPLTGLRSAPFSRTAVTRAARQGEPARAGARQASRHGMGPRRRKETGWKPRQPNSPAHNQAVCMRSVLSLPSIPPAQIGSGVGKVLRLRLRSRRRSWLRGPCPPPEQPRSSGLQAEARNDGHDPRAGARAGSAGVGARTCLVFGLAASTSASTWSCPPHSAGDKGTGACCRHGQAEVFSSWCISPACGSSVQVSRAARTAAGSAPGKRPAIRGNQWLRTTFRARASPGQAGLPPASCVAASAAAHKTRHRPLVRIVYRGRAHPVRARPADRGLFPRRASPA